jgi:hypothetical protein
MVRNLGNPRVAAAATTCTDPSSGVPTVALALDIEEAILYYTAISLHDPDLARRRQTPGGDDTRPYLQPEPSSCGVEHSGFESFEQVLS